MKLLNTAHIKAAALCASTADIRYYLNGVLLEVMPTETRLVATDGHLAGILRTVESNPADDCVIMIIPGDVIKKALTGWKCAVSQLDREGDKWSLNGVLFTPIDGRFPDYRRIVPERTNGDAALFNPELVAVFGKVAKALGKKADCAFIRQNGNDSALVQVCGAPEFIGVLMPMRGPKVAPEYPTWGRDYIEPVAILKAA